MQDIIDTDFRKCTVISVMHRLAHAPKYDKIAVLDGGKLVAFDLSANLVRSDSGLVELYTMKDQV